MIGYEATHQWPVQCLLQLGRRFVHSLKSVFNQLRRHDRHHVRVRMLLICPGLFSRLLPHFGTRLLLIKILLLIQLFRKNKLLYIEAIFVLLKDLVCCSFPKNTKLLRDNKKIKTARKSTLLTISLFFSIFPNVRHIFIFKTLFQTLFTGYTIIAIRG